MESTEVWESNSTAELSVRKRIAAGNAGSFAGLPNRKIWMGLQRLPGMCGVKGPHRMKTPAQYPIGSQRRPFFEKACSVHESEGVWRLLWLSLGSISFAWGQPSFVYPALLPLLLLLLVWMPPLYQFWRCSSR